MKVYVLESSDEWGEEHKLHGVFSTFEKAGEANEILDIAGTITEVELDEVKIEHWGAGFGPGRYERKKL
jgi:hypothetical protein